MPRNIHIIGVDPGLTSGVAELRGTQFQSWEIAAVDTVSYVEGLILRSTARRIYVACERFIQGVQTARKTRQPEAYDLGISLRDLCREHARVMYVLQMASVAKRYSDTALKTLHWHTPGKRHANDAARHVAYSLLRVHPAVLYAGLHPDRVIKTGADD